MVKGAQKRMVVVKINDSEVFEEAYFVVRRGVGGAKMDMLSEANRIVEASGIRRKRCNIQSARAIIAALICFFTGSVIGAALVGILMMVS